MSHTPDRLSMDVDIVCVGFGPAMGGFLSTLSKHLLNPDGSPAIESRVAPGMPLQVLCYERSDDLGFGVSGVVTPGRSIRSSYPELDISQIPLAAPVKHEEVFYLLDPVGASRRSFALRSVDTLLKATRWLWCLEDHAIKLPWLPPFLEKHGGMVLSMGQFMQWVGGQVMGSGTVQIWPATPVSAPLWENDAVRGVRLIDQGTDKMGNPTVGFMPGMDIKAALSVIGDGPVGSIGRQIDEKLGLPKGHHQYEWAIGMKMVVDLPESCTLEPGTVLHTLGFPEPEIFGFLYVHPGRIASFGIFVPSWFDNPTRTAYRYLQHWIMHPALWRHLEGATLRSWGAKSLQESGRQGEPYLVGDGFVRIGEGSGSTNVLSGSGVDEAWGTGVLLAEAVVELARSGKPLTKENLDATYVRRRRESWIDREAVAASKARDGFQRGFLRGLIGMALTGFSGGRLNWPARPLAPHKRLPSVEEYFKGRIPADEIARLRAECQASSTPFHQALMDRAGWPSIPLDGKLLISHQDALLMGGKVQAPQGYADHVVFINPDLCRDCGAQVCVDACSGQAIAPGAGGIPTFDREKCVHCGACLWNCSKSRAGDEDRGNIDFRAGSGGLHSAEN